MCALVTGVQTCALPILVALFREAGHSRIPVFRDSLDEVHGMIHVRDVYAHLADPERGPDPEISALVRPVLFVPESMGVLDLLARMRAEVGRASGRARVCQYG